MIVIGAVVRLGKVGDSRIIEMFRRAELGGLNMGDVIVVLSALIIVVGVFTLIFAADGGIGACFRKKPLLVVVSRSCISPGTSHVKHGNW